MVKRMLFVLCGLMAVWAPPTGGVRAEPPASVRAETAVDPVAEVFAAGRVRDLLDVVVTEGGRHGLDLERSLFPGEGGRAWASAVSAIQAPEPLAALVGGILRDRLSDADARDVAAFFGTDLGRRLVSSEIAARRRMLDAIDAPEAVQGGGTVEDAQGGLFDEMVERLDLLGPNVSGGLNANLAFYRGLGDGGALRSTLGERDLIAMVWRQEPGVRHGIEGWLRSYMALAYRQFTQAELTRYMAFSESPAGRTYGAAMDAAFGSVFERTSYDLGRAAARFIAQDAT